MGLRIILLCTSILLLTGATYEEIMFDKRRQMKIYEELVNESRNKSTELESKLSYLKSRRDSLESVLITLESFIKNYENEKYMTPEEIAVETNIIIYLSEEVERIQESFRNKVISLYKHGKNYELELLLSSRTPNEYLRRNQYLQKFSHSRKRELKELKSKKYILEEKKKMLALSTSLKRIYVENKKNEKVKTESDIKLTDSEIIKLTEDHEQLAELTRLYERNMNSVRNFILNFKSNRDKYKDTKRSRLNYSSDDLFLQKGNINMPVDAGLVNSYFGLNYLAETGTEYFSNGIGISVSMGSRVYAIASGTVTLTGESPYYGKTVILKHPNGFRSVYSGLSEINVTPGQQVKLNQIIAKSGMVEGSQMLYFELWHGGTPLNPTDWLNY
jgi:septal ring factor EnvC (AmiA/AmiB activator)